MDLIDMVGLDEEIRCEMCRNPMHTNRGCDGNCKYDEKLYERIIQILDKRIKQLPPAQPEVIRCKECKHWMDIDDGRQKHRMCADLLGEWYCADAERREG